MICPKCKKYDCSCHWPFVRRLALAGFFFIATHFFQPQGQVGTFSDSVIGGFSSQSACQTAASTLTEQLANVDIDPISGFVASPCMSTTDALTPGTATLRRAQ